MVKPSKAQRQNSEDERSPAETERIREATLKTLLNTPPKPHVEMIKDRRKPREK
jgi:hypothetical protein